jgi:hypothetical protein
MTLAEQIEKVITSRNWGKPSARKGGRNPKWPWVPIINYGEDWRSRTRTYQPRGVAFETREQAVEYASKAIAGQMELYRRMLHCPRQRAMREQYGLPREIE